MLSLSFIMMPHWVASFSALHVKLGFHTLTLDYLPPQTILYCEALCICTAMLWDSGLDCPAHWLVFTDSLNCVEMFNSLSAQEGYNELLLFMMRILITMNILLHVSMFLGLQGNHRCIVSQPASSVSSIPPQPENPHLWTPTWCDGVGWVMFLTPAKPRQPPRAAWSREHLHKWVVALGHALENSMTQTYSSHILLSENLINSQSTWLLCPITPTQFLLTNPG